MTSEPTFEGRCACDAVRFRMTGTPLFVHCCHCRCVCFVRVGTLDTPDALPPDTPAVAEYYQASKVWPAERLQRRAALLAKNKPV